MLEFLRHQTKPIMITLAVIIIIAFSFWGGYTQPGSEQFASPNDVVLTALGRQYSRVEVERLQRLYTIASGLRLPGIRNYFASELTSLQLLHRRQEDGMPLEFGGAPMDFAINLIVLRDALEKHGIHASDDECRTAFRQLGSFQVEGQFDPERARSFEEQLGSMGFRINDVYEIIRDSLGYQKLQKTIAGNVVTNAKLTEQFYAATYQTVKAATIPFPLDTFKKAAQVSDEDIKKYFDENKDSYKTPEKRAVSYVFFPKPDTEGKNAEDTVKLRNAYGERVNNFALAVIAPGADFDALVKKELEADKSAVPAPTAPEKKEPEAKKTEGEPKGGTPDKAVAEAKKDAAPKQAGAEFTSVPAFSQDSPPEGLKDASELVTSIFLNVPDKHPVSDPVETEKGYYIFKVTSVEAPKPEALKDVQGRIREVLVDQKAMETMQKAANDAKKKLEEAVKGGRKFEDVAKEAGFTPQMLPEFSPSTPPSDLSNGREIAFEARSTPAGGFTKPLATESGLLLVHVLSKELRKRDDSATTKTTMAKSLDGMTRGDLFRAWFERRYSEASIKADVMVQTAMMASS